jgi:hypothetical protein
VTRRYEHIRDKVARAAVEKLEKIRNTPSFVEVFVGMPEPAKEPDSKLLN